MTARESSSTFSSLKLALGQSRAAWRRYPALRKKIRDLPSGPPILVTGMYRSGTTWVGTMLAAPGVWHVHEPFNPNRGFWDRELDYARAGEVRPDIDRLVSEILRGRRRSALRIPHAQRWFLPVRLLPLRPRRVLIKDPSAALLSEYLTRRHGMRTLVLFRHPAAVAASLRRLDWPTGLLVGGLLELDPLPEALGPLGELMEEARGRRDLFSGAVLYACIASVLDGFVSGNPVTMTPLHFEELCRDPIARFRELYAELELPYSEDVTIRHAALCHGEDGKTESRPHGVRRASIEMTTSWKAELTPEDVEIVRAVWERAGIERYRAPELWETADGSAAAHS